MSMSRKHYNEFAKAIKSEDRTDSLVIRLACSIATICKDDNASFSVDRFMVAAGIPDTAYRVGFVGDVMPSV